MRTCLKHTPLHLFWEKEDCRPVQHGLVRLQRREARKDKSPKTLLAESVKYGWLVTELVLLSLNLSCERTESKEQLKQITKYNFCLGADTGNTVRVTLRKQQAEISTAQFSEIKNVLY